MDPAFAGVAENSTVVFINIFIASGAGKFRSFSWHQQKKRRLGGCKKEKGVYICIYTFSHITMIFKLKQKKKNKKNKRKRKKKEKKKQSISIDQITG